MSRPVPRFDATYLNRKRLQLTQLRDALRKTAYTAQAAEADLVLASAVQAREYEDEAQRLDALEKEGILVGRDVERLARVERALEKIAEGSYGRSDISGQPIPDSRLDAMPDAIDTLAEQEASERVGQRPR
jgi:DnaK suppressor protein